MRLRSCWTQLEQTTIEVKLYYLIKFYIWSLNKEKEAITLEAIMYIL